MDLLHSKPDDWSLLGLILGLPLYGAFFNGVFGKRFGKGAVRFVALAATGLSFLAAIVTFLHLHEVRHEAEAAALQAFQAAHAGQAAPAELLEHPTRLSWFAWKWLSMAGADGASRLGIDVKFMVDELSGVMMLVVTGIGFLIHVYATSYMAKDPGYHRFFAYLNLFLFAMLVLVLADNMPLLFVGWEGVGLCSYLLIGFWFENGDNAAAGRKAFIANRIGDVGMIGGMLVIAYYTGALDWHGINEGAGHLIDTTNRIGLWPLNSAHPKFTVSPATVACLAIFLGCTGKSAQIPLYVWLPDAMAGPTPVSALIHAATMVTSGLYLICRLNLVFSFSPVAMTVVACVGALTALFAATIALVQNDIKKVLAYSTVSQLGFMFLGVGVGAFGMGFFHVLTHAFFKACLFLGAGSVIHAMHARIHDDVKSQDMRHMGGLRRYLPWTYLSMGAATLAITGFPLTAGFFSKDGILFHAWSNQVLHPRAATAQAILEEYGKRGLTTGPIYQRALQNAHAYYQAPAWLGKLLFVVGILAATCTAFYMFRLLFKTFWGEFRGWEVDPRAALATSPIVNAEPLEDEPEGGGHGHAEDDEAHGHEHGHDEHDELGPAPKEAPWQMAFPVAILGAAALVVGWLYAEPFHVERLGHWLAPMFHEVSHTTTKLKEGAEKLEWPLMAPGLLALCVGAGLDWFWYVKDGEQKAGELMRAWPRLHRAAYNKWYVDEAYEATVIGGTDALADGAAIMDSWIVDGVLAKLSAAVVSGFGALLRAFQTGVVHVYGSFLAVGAIAVVIFFARPHADVSTRDVSKEDSTHAPGEGKTFLLEAAPGLGYEYKWTTGDATGDKDFVTGDAALSRTVFVPLDQARTITLSVKNAFGRTTERVIELSNPKPVPLGLPSGSASGPSRPGGARPNQPPRPGLPPGGGH